MDSLFVIICGAYKMVSYYTAASSPEKAEAFLHPSNQDSFVTLKN